MLKIIILMLLAACSKQSPHRPPVIPAPDVNGKASFMVMIPVRDKAQPYSITPYDNTYITNTYACSGNFRDTKIEYAPLSDDGVSTKNITFYCV